MPNGSIIITGEIATDHLMRFPGRITDHSDPRRTAGQAGRVRQQICDAHRGCLIGVGLAEAFYLACSEYNSAHNGYPHTRMATDVKSHSLPR